VSRIFVLLSSHHLCSYPSLRGTTFSWGGAPPPGKEPYFWGRSMADQSLAIMKWFARGGSHMNCE
jgi:hypothetical protein